MPSVADQQIAAAAQHRHGHVVLQRQSVSASSCSTVVALAYHLRRTTDAKRRVLRQRLVPEELGRQCGGLLRQSSCRRLHQALTLAQPRQQQGAHQVAVARAHRDDHIVRLDRLQERSRPRLRSLPTYCVPRA